MKTSSTLYGVQVLRGLAALLVVLFHARFLVSTPTIEWLFRNGAAGVDVFFVISGLVMALTADRFTPAGFLAKRLLRIVPLYWLFSAAKLAVLLVANVSARKIVLSPLYVAKCFLFIPAFDGDGNIYPLITAGWSLSFEMYFYVLCAAALFARRLNFIALTVLMVVFATLLGLAPFLRPIATTSAPLSLLAPISLEFAAGMILGKLWRSGFRANSGLAAALALGGFVAILLVPPYVGQLDPLRPVVFGLPAMAIVGGTLFLEPQVAFRRWAGFVLLGDASYSLYLAHTAVLPIADKVLGKLTQQPLIVFWGIVIAAVISGVAAHLFVEQPLNMVIKRLAGRNAAPVGAASGTPPAAS